MLVRVLWRHPAVRFCSTSAAVLAVYLVYGYLQEYIFTLPGLRTFGEFITLAQFAAFSVLGYVHYKVSVSRSLCGRVRRRAPWRNYLLLGVLSASTMGLSNSALTYLNYPTQLLFKSCKLIPVMVGGIVIQGKRYHPLEYFSVLLMSVGLVWFTSIDKGLNANFNMTGVLFISLALGVDAIIGNYQEKTMREYSVCQTEMMLFSYSFGTVVLLLSTLLDGSLFPAWEAFLANCPTALYIITGLSLTGYWGISLVLVLVKTNGALVSVTVTTLRKVVSTVISFLTFAKPFSVMYVLAGGVMLAGISINIIHKNRRDLGRCFAPMQRAFAERRLQMSKKDDGYSKKSILSV